MKPLRAQAILERAHDDVVGARLPVRDRARPRDHRAAVFTRNMRRWITGRKGALTTYYPEETRADYAPLNRGKHILMQRADGKPAVHRLQPVRDRVPGQGDRDRGRVRSGRPGAPEVPGALRDRLLALRLLRAVRRGLPRGRDPHGEGSAQPARARPRRHVAAKEELLTWNPQRDVAKPYPPNAASRRKR